MSTDLQTVDDLFKTAGGSVRIAAALNRNQYTVDRWARTGIPVEHWEKLKEKYNLTIETIHRISERARKDWRAQCNGE